MTKEFKLDEKIEGWIERIKLLFITANNYEDCRNDMLNKIKEDIEEFIKIIEARIYNQLRIHWHSLRNKTPVEVADFIENIINKRAGAKLI